MEASIRSKVAAEERAHKIVERLVLDDEVTDEFLLNSVSRRLQFDETQFIFHP